MSKNEVKVTIKIDDSGTLKATTKEAKGLSSAIDGVTTSTNKLNKSKGQHNKLEKGTAGLTSNSTKAFSKQAQSLGGGNGLVAAYATLAANIFAITAAFGALRRAAGFEQLQAGLIHTGNAAGANLPKVAQSLREITGAAISTKDAMEAVALGTSAGFSTKQLEGLTKVAKGASLALGRDMSDAMSRLVRGASKLEPEILDELGIMVRLDTVTQKYATTIGKTAGQLTQFERRMAFTNAIIEQGEKKFGAIAEAIDPNAYDQLSASFSDITQTFLSFLNTALIPVVKFFSSNIGFLVAGAIAFASTLTKQIAPGMYASAKAASANAAALSALAIEQRALLGTIPLVQKEYNVGAIAINQNTKELALLESQQAAVIASTATLRRELADLQIANTLDTQAIAAKNAQIAESQGTYDNITAAVTRNKLETEKAYKKLNKSLGDSIARNKEGVDGLTAIRKSRIANTKALLKGEMGLKTYIGLVREENVLIATKKDMLKPVIAERARLRKEIYLQSLSSVKLSQANALEAISELGVVAASKLATKAIIEEVIATKIATINANLLSTSLTWVAASSRIAAFAMKFVGVAFLKFLPVIGLAIMAFSMLAPLVSGLFGDSDLEKELDEITEGFDSFDGIANQLSTTLEDSTSIIDNYISTLSVAVGVFGQIGTAASKARDAVSSVYNEQILAAQIKAKQYEDAAAAGYMGSESDMQYWEGRADAIKQEADKRTKLAVLQTVNIGLDKLQENSSLAESLNTQITAIKALNLQYNNGKISVNAYLARLSNMQGVMKATEQTIKGAGDEMSAYSKALIGLHKKADNPFTPTIKAVSVMQSSLSDLSGDILAQEGYMQKLSTSNSVAYDSFVKLGSASLAAVSALNGFGDHSTEGGKLAAGLKIASDLMKDYQQDVDLATTKAKEHSRIIKGLKGLSKVSTEAISASYKEQNLAIDDQISLLKKARAIELSLGNNTLAITKQIDELKASRPKEAKKISDIAAVELNNKKTLLDLESKSMGLLKERLALETSIAAEKQKQTVLSYGPTATSDSSTSEELAFWEDQKKSKEDFIKEETELKIKTINMEYALLDAKFKFLMAQADANPAITLDKDFVTSYTTMLAENKAAALKNNALKQTNELSKITTKGMELQNKLAIEAQALTLKQVESLTSMLDLERSLTEERNNYNESIALISGVENAKMSLDLFKEEAAERRELIEYETSLKIANNTREIGVLELKNLALSKEGKDTVTNDAEIAALKFANRRLEIEQEIALVRNDTEGIQKQAKYIDEVATVYTNMIKIMADTDLGKTIDAAVKPITSIVQTWAAANMSITQDKEKQAKNSKKISALSIAEDKAVASKDYALALKLGEKKSSLEEKNAALSNLVEEKKHKANLSMAATAMGGAATIMKSLADQQDTSSKKGFESAKKMQLAAAIMGTAAAITNALSTLPYPAAPIAAATAAATGAIQVATIAATTFEGGGSVTSPSMGGTSGAGATTGGGAATGYTGTVLGSTSTSKSMDNTEKLLEDISAINYRGLSRIEHSVDKLNGSIVGLVSSIFRTGMGVVDEGSATIDLNTGSKDSLSDKVGSFLGGISETLGKYTGKIGNALFGGKTKTTLKDSGYKLGSIAVADLRTGVDMSVEEYYRLKIKKKGGWLKKSKTKYKTKHADASEEVTLAFSEMFNDIGDSLIDVAYQVTDGSQEAVDRILAYVFDPGKISLKGMDSEEVTAKITEMLSYEADVAAEATLGVLVGAYQKVNEGMYETAMRMAATKVVVEDVFKKMGMSIEISVLDVGDSLTTLAGGLAEFVELFDTFYDAFFSDADKFKDTSELLNGALEDMSLVLPTSREGYKLLTGAMDLNTEAGQENFITLMKLTEKADTYYAHLEEIADKKYDMEVELLRALGLEEEATTMERIKSLKELDESLRPLQLAIWAVADAAEAATSALDDTSTALKAAFGRERDRITEEYTLRKKLASELESKMRSAFSSVKKVITDEYNLKKKLASELESDMRSAFSSVKKVITDEYNLKKKLAGELESDMRAAFSSLKQSLTDEYTLKKELADSLNTIMVASFEREKSLQTDLYNATVERLSLEETAANDSISILNSAISSLKSAKDSYIKVDQLLIEKSINSLRAMQVSTAAGNYDSLNGLDDVLSILSGDTSTNYMTYEEYRRDSKQAQVEIAQLESISSSKLSVEELTLEAIKSAKDAAQAQNKAILDSLDAQLASTLRGNSLNVEANGIVRGLDGSIVGIDGRLVGLDGQIVGLDGSIMDLSGTLTGGFVDLDTSIQSWISAMKDADKGKLDDQLAYLDAQLNSLLGIDDTLVTSFSGLTAVIDEWKLAVIAADEDAYNAQIAALDAQLNSLLGIDDTLITSFSGLTAVIDEWKIAVIAADEDAYNAQLAALDMQLNTLLGIDTNIQSLPEAIANYLAAKTNYDDIVAGADTNTEDLALYLADYGDIIKAAMKDLESNLLGANLDDRLLNNGEDQLDMLSTVSVLLSNLGNSVVAAISSAAYNIVGTINAKELTGITSTGTSPTSFETMEIYVDNGDRTPTSRTVTVGTYATGGTHPGGWRVVGEEGPELENTGKSNIYSNSRSLFDTTALEKEIRDLREDLKSAQYQIAKNTSKTAKFIERWDGDGMPEERVI